jgi:hypothetical protein
LSPGHDEEENAQLPALLSPSLLYLFFSRATTLRAITTDTCLRSQFLIPIQIFSDTKMEGYPLGEAQESPLVDKKGPGHLKSIWAPAITPPRLSRKAQNSAQNWGSLKAEIRKIYLDEDNTLANTMQKIEADYGFKAW